MTPVGTVGWVRSPTVPSSLPLVALLVFTLLGAACSSAEEPVLEGVTPFGTVPMSTVPLAPTSSVLAAAPATALMPISPLRDRIRSLDTALDVPQAQADPAPVSITIDRLGVDSAPVTQVGVVANGDMEIPGANEVGWYRHGPSPGAAGSSVLAAHVAFNGEDGVFRYLTDLAPQDRFTVAYDDGTETDFLVASRRQYDKDELPFDALFAKEGIPSLALITCGGSFNRSLSSYEANIVVYAIPM